MPSLTDYLSAENETQTAFARRAGLSDSTLSRVLAGKTPPTAALVEKVREATGGQVTEAELFAAWRAARSTTPAARAAA
jgi:transcriptional regulator with XRE-family HTH domain